MARTKQEVLTKTSALLRARRNRKIKKIVTKGRNTSAKGAPNSAVATSSQENSFQCDVCSKTYSTLSNLNEHKKIRHSNRIFLCPHCNEKQSNKFSHIRHIQRKHSGESVENVNQNERFDQENVLQLTDGAKNDLIEKLQKENELLRKEIEELRKESPSLSAGNCPQTSNQVEDSSIETNATSRPKTGRNQMGKEGRKKSHANVKVETVQRVQRATKGKIKRDEIYVY